MFYIQLKFTGSKQLSPSLQALCTKYASADMGRRSQKYSVNFLNRISD